MVCPKSREKKTTKAQYNLDEAKTNRLFWFEFTTVRDTFASRPFVCVCACRDAAARQTRFDAHTITISISFLFTNEIRDERLLT